MMVQVLHKRVAMPVATTQTEHAAVLPGLPMLAFRLQEMMCQTFRLASCAGEGDALWAQLSLL
jgi:hypothetical protein